MRGMAVLRLIAAVSFFLPVALCQVPSSLTVQGIAGTSVVLSVADLSKLPKKSVQVTDHGKPATFEGVLLADVLAKVALPLGESFHSTVASYCLVVEARDGYRAVFAWAELDSTFMDKPVYLVLKRDDQALGEKEGPLQLLVPGEKRGARWVRQVAALRVRQVN